MNRLTCGDLDPLSATNYRQLSCVGIVAIVFMGTAIAIAQNPIMLALKGQTVTGTVSENKEEDSFKNGKEVILASSAIEYVDGSGTKHTLWVRGQRDIGSTADLVYLPSDPEVSLLVGDKAVLGGASLPFTMGLLILTWTVWHTRKLWKKRGPLKALIARVPPIPAEVVHVMTESHTTTSSNNRKRTSRKYRLVGVAKIKGNQPQEFESFRYQGWSPVEKSARVNLYVDPTDPNFYYLSTQLAKI